MWYKLNKIYIHTPNTTHNLPSEYQEVEYIQSSGNWTWTWQYINTWISIESWVSLKVEMDFHWLNTSTEEREMFAYYEWQYSDYLIGFSSGAFLTVLNSHTAGSLPATWTPNTYATNTRYKVVAEWVTASSTNTPYLFASNENWTDKWDISAKLYYCKVWKDNVMIRDFIPCYRKSDDVIWMYDLVNNQFYTNAWTWTFTKWADILPTIEHQVRPDNLNDFWYSDYNRKKYQSLVNSIWSVQFQDTWKRYRFNSACYIWNRIAVNVNGNTMTKVNLDTLTVTQTVTLARTPEWRIWYFWDDRILTSQGIMDFNWNFVSTFSYRTVAPWLPWIVWAHDTSYRIYKWVVEWDNITFTYVGTWWYDQSIWIMCYWRLWAYLINSNDTSWNWNSTYVNPSTDTLTNFTWWSRGRCANAVAWADGKLYRNTMRDNWWWRLQKIWTTDEWFVWDTLSTVWTAYWNRFGKFLWNIVTWWMNVNNGTWAGYWSNNYYIDTSWNLTKVQTDAFAYDSGIWLDYGFIDENWLLYPSTWWWWTWVILKTDKTFTNLNWRNPFLWR